MRLITLFVIAVFIATPVFAAATPATPTELDLDLLNQDSSNINTSLLLTINFTDGDGNATSLDSVNDAGNGADSTIDWGIVLGKSNMYSNVRAKDGTDITITVDGYYGFNLTANEGGVIVDTIYLVEIGSQTDEFAIVMAAAIASNGQAKKKQSSNALYRKRNVLTPGDNSDDAFALDLRTYAEYSLGHIPGAINIYYRDLGKPSALNYLRTKLEEYNTTGGKNELHIYSNTHHIATMVTQYLNETQGFPAKYNTNGFADWTKNETVAPGRFKECTSFYANGTGYLPADCTSNNYITTTSGSVNASSLSGEGYPIFDCISGPATPADLSEIARCMYDARFGDPNRPDVRVTAREVYTLLNDGDSSNDPFVLSNRGTTWADPCPTGSYYTRGHISGAIGVDWCYKAITKRTELRALNDTDFMPQDQTIAHHCWVGASQQYGVTWYNLLGYEVQSFDFGMNGWSDNDYIRESVINPAAWYKRDFGFDTVPDLSNPATDKATYSETETVSVTWSGNASAPTPPDNVNVQVYNTVDAAEEGFYSSVDPSVTSWAGHTVGATEVGDTINVYIYFADDTNDRPGDPGTTDIISTSYTVTAPAPEFPFGPAILFGLFIPIYFSIRRRFLENPV